MTDKTQEELDFLLLRFGNSCISQIPRDINYTKGLILDYINKNYEVKTKKAPKSLSGVHSHVKTIIPQQNQLDEILDSIAHTIGEIKWREQAKQAILKSYIPIEEVEDRVVEAYHVGWSARSAEGGKKAAATRKKQFSIVQEKRKAWLDNKLKEG